jgi:hypothetical protein
MVGAIGGPKRWLVVVGVSSSMAVISLNHNIARELVVILIII